MTMQIASTAPTTADTGTSSSNSSASTGTSALGNEQIFLQLLVAQIKNQDPLNPTDSTTFMTQLAQFSDLEQLISLNTTVGNIGTALGVTPNAQKTTDPGSTPA
jgi:flagellar basal-body rod modification protein FlgD